MSTTSTAPSAVPDFRARALPILDRTALVCVLLLPLLLMHAHGIAEVALAIADFCFLGRCAITRNWAWARTYWFRVGLLWWGWVVLCSLPIRPLDLGEYGGPSLLQGVVDIRFLVLVAAMEHSILRDPAPRRWMFGVIAASTIYMAVQSAFQFAFGVNMYGFPKSGGIILTGPFHKPRVGPPLARTLLPVLIPPAAALLDRRRWVATLGAGALLLGGVALMVAVNQRMPLVLMVFGLMVGALLLKRLRGPVIVAAVVGGLLLAASPIIAPGIAQRLIGKTTHQMVYFPSSPYGELYTRALEIGLQNPVTGLGADGFRYGCPNPRYFRPTFDGVSKDGGGPTACASHPHNPFMQALVNGGFPGLALFCWLCLAWMAPLWRGLWKNPDPLRVGLFTTALIQLWPIASTSGFTAMPMGGWFFLLLGWGMAEARWRRPAEARPR